MKRATLTKIVRFLVKTLTRTEYLGGEYIPRAGGILITTNHLSRLDIPLLLLTPGREDVIALATDKYKSHKLFKWILETAECIWIDRDRADFAAVRAGAEYLRKGGALGIAPEGTRSQTGGLIAGKPGTVLIAERTRVPIVPVGIAGTDTGFEKLKRMQRPRLVVRYGPAYMLPEMDRDDREGWLARCTDEIMCRIAVLLPPEHWGIYADHPRLKELLISK
jgi:1-acyl-sn-glycerol-3-phosphate acyltransferase